MTNIDREAALPAPNADDLRRILGDLDDAKVLEILKLSPTEPELEEAAEWAAGDGDILDRSGHHLVGTVARIFDILIRDEEPENR
ncbi:MAG: hypothetical protein NUV72_05445 [Bauldia sp.]|jgi:hypothetical protein|nr:hypothetical protein [Bauldia sp.]